MRTAALLAVFGLCLVASAAEVESRVLTHYVPQDLLETAIRTEGWTEVPLALKGGVRKGDTIRLWTGGSIDRGNGDQPGQNIVGPAGPETDVGNMDTSRLALSTDRAHVFALLCKTETSGIKKALPAGKPLEIKLTKDNEKLWIGFNDEKGRYLDNHLGKGRLHELDPAWIRIEVVRTIVD